MGKETNISWCDATFNPWIGCTPVGPGCDHCYAERFWRMHGLKPGQDQPRKITSDKYWKDPIKWNAVSAAAGERRKVFCGSLCDVFDNRAPEGARERLWGLIKDTPNLDWLLLTKRSTNIEKYLPIQRDLLGGMWVELPNVWLGVTVENRKHGLPRIDILRNIPATIRFLSIEPLLEDLGQINLEGISWCIVGGESGHNARSMHRRWVESIRFQCIDAGVLFFMKQMSERDHGKTFRDISTFPSVLQVRQFPGDL